MLNVEIESLALIAAKILFCEVANEQKRLQRKAGSRLHKIGIKLEQYFAALTIICIFVLLKN